MTNETISFRASELNLDGIAVGEKIRATYDGRSFGLLLFGRRRDLRKGGNGTLRCVSVEGDLVTMAWKPDACEEPKGPRHIVGRVERCEVTCTVVVE